MKRNSNIESADGPKICLDIPAEDTDLFGSRAVNEILSFLSRFYTDEFTITELTDAVDYSQPSVSKAVDLLAANNLVVERRDGNARLVGINRARLSIPNDPIVQVPQSAFQPPIRAAVEELRSELDGIVGIVLYGSVANGQADRRSDIDLWVLVEEDRTTKQRAANRVRQDLEEREFEGSRYAYDVDVEALPAVPSYEDELREILSDGIVLYEAEKFETVQNMVLHGELDE